MSVAYPTPDETDAEALDDRNRDIFTDEDYELDENLAYNIGFGGRDPAIGHEGY